jgi:superfamily II DNA or RNA helicase
MSFTLRPFQQKAIDEVVEAAKKYHNMVVVAQTGAGKTVIAAAILKRFDDKNRKAIFIVDRIDLTSQTIQKLGNIKYGIIASGYPEPNYDDCNIFLAMIQTLEGRPKWHDKHWDLIMLDECHDTAWRNLSLKLIEASTKWVIGLTATPYRGSKKEFFADIFEAAIVAPSFAELQDLGYLARIEYYPVSHADFSQVKIISNDYSSNEVSKLVNTEATIKECLNEYLKKGQNKRAIAFGSTVDHAKEICRVANAMGIVSELVVGDTKSTKCKITGQSDRDKIFERCDRGETRMLVTCDALSKGFDLPAIKSVLLMAPTLSKPRILQRVGRGARPYNNETCIVFDCVGCLDNLPALPCEIVHTKESILARAPLKEAGEAPIKTCPECNRIIGAYHSVCPFCAYNFPKRKVEVVEMERRWDRLITAREVKADGREDIHREYYRQLLRKDYEKTRCTTGAYTKYKERNFTAFPLPKKDWGIGAIFDGDRSRFDLFCRTVRSGAAKRFGDADHRWAISRMIETEWGRQPAAVKT